MKIYAISDFQADTNPAALEKINIPPDVDLIVVAGDLNPPLTRSILSLNEIRRGIPAVYVPGNRDFYNQNMYYEMKMAKKLADDLGIFLLNDEYVKLDDVVIYGTTFWTNFRAEGNIDNNILVAKLKSGDFNYIRDGVENKRWTPKDAINANRNSIEKIEDVLVQNKEQVILVTHNAPSKLSRNVNFPVDGRLNLFVSDAEHLMRSEYAPLAWIHGGTHQPCDYELGYTRVMSHPYGYEKELEEGIFEKYKLIDTDDLTKNRAMNHKI